MENCSFQESRPNFLLFWLAVNAVGVLASAAYFIYLVVIYATEGASDAAGKMAGQSSLNTFLLLAITLKDELAYFPKVYSLRT